MNPSKAIEISIEASEFLSGKLIGRLATASTNGQPHVVPVWFLWENEALWISSYRSTRKVIDLERNPKSAIVIDVEESGGGLTAVMIEGNCELITQSRAEAQKMIEKIYLKYLGPEGIREKDPQTWLHSPENVLLKLTPNRIKVW